MTDVNVVINEHRRQFVELLRAKFGGLDFWRCSKKWKQVKYEEVARMAGDPLEFYAQQQRSAAIAYAKELGELYGDSVERGSFEAMFLKPWINGAMAMADKIGVSEWKVLAQMADEGVDRVSMEILRKKAIAHLRRLAKRVRSARKMDLGEDAIDYFMRPVYVAISAYRAIGVLPPARGGGESR